MSKTIEVPIIPELVIGDELKRFFECLKSAVEQHERPKKTIGEIRYENAVLAVLTRIADALDAIHGTLASAMVPEPPEEVPDDPE